MKSRWAIGGARTCILVIAAALSRAADAQWEARLLHPDGARGSGALGVTSELQAGIVIAMDWNYHPVVWHGTDSYVDLLPTWAYFGQVNAVDGPWQAGFVSGQGATFAALWQGTRESFVALSPIAGYIAPKIYGIASEEQVGVAGHLGEGMEHACLWHGTIESFVDLHPAGARWSKARATDGSWQGGWGDVLAVRQFHAMLWKGTAASFIDMHPAGAVQSRIWDMTTGTQVGWAQFGSQHRAVVWHDTPESCVQLHPAGAMNSYIQCTAGTIHGGYVSYTGSARATLWVGDDTDDLIDLHEPLGPGWRASGINDIFIENGFIYAAGSAARVNGPSEAVLWIGRLPEPRPHRRPILNSPARP